MSFFDYLPFILWWLLIIGLVTFGLFQIGLALISLVVEREDADQ